MSRRVLVLYALLLVVPTVVIGIAAYALLWNEHDRIQKSIEAENVVRAKELAANLDSSIRSVRDDILASLATIPPDRLDAALMEQQARNPLIRNAFQWSVNDGLRFAGSAASPSALQGEFLSRYKELLADPPWMNSESDLVPARVAPFRPLAASASPGPPIPNPSYRLVEGDSGVHAGDASPFVLPGVTREYHKRLELRRFAQMRATAVQGDRLAGGARGGWVTWHRAKEINCLGWYQESSSRPVRGVDLDMEQVLDFLMPSVFDRLPRGGVYGLMDDANDFVYVSNPAGNRPEGPAFFEIPVGRTLPDWSVAVHLVSDEVMLGQGQTLVVLSGVLLGCFLLAILLGGTALFRQAYASRKDALQKTSFVSSVSHELKTPLTSIRMYVDLLIGGADDNPAKRDKYLGIIAAESRRLTRLVSNVLSFGRLEQGVGSYDIETLDLVECLDNIINRQQERVEQAGMKLVDRVAAMPIPVQVDRDVFEQVILNLLDNALKYASPDVAGVDAEIRLESARNGRFAELKVMDRGPGIPTEHRERIFEQFHRVDERLTSKQKGTGLGLSIARRLMRELGGDLVYEEREGGGSTFVVKIKRGSESSHEEH